MRLPDLLLLLALLAFAALYGDDAPAPRADVACGTHCTDAPR